jgi:phosphate transport system permease protein
VSNTNKSSESKKNGRTIELVQRSLARRRSAELRFRWYGRVSIFIGIFTLVVLFIEIFGNGLGGFQQTRVQLAVHFDPEILEISDVSDTAQLTNGNYEGVLRAALAARFPEVTERSEKRELNSLISIGATYELRDQLIKNPDLLGQTKTLWVLADDDVDTYYKSLRGGDAYSARTSEGRQIRIQDLIEKDAIRTQFNTRLFTSGDSSEPEMAGILGAVTGSLLTLLVTFALSFPIGVAAAIYLEEYAPRNKLTDFIEVNISNLAAVPSIIFGLLGLAIFINLFGMPRSVPLVGGLVLTLLTMPTIIISSRNSIKSVPPSIREAALGIGASKMQMILHHVLPLAMPGMLTGAILGMAHALGETAPLLMIGMVAFIVDVPNAVTAPATVLPVQIYLWSDSPERAFVERTSAAIMVLLVFLVCMNTLAVFLRKRLERRW